MGLVSWLKGKLKNDSIIEYNNEYKNMTLEEVLNRNSFEQGSVTKRQSADVLEAADSNAEQIEMMKIRLKELEAEYSDVTGHLTDVDIVENFMPDAKAAAQDCARQIINLNKERDVYKKKERKITEAQFRYIEQYEDDIPGQILKLEEQEKYMELVMSDLKQIEGERDSISYEKEYAIDKREFLKKLSVGGCILIASLFVVIFLIQENTGADLNLPFFMLALLALALTGYSVMENRNMLLMIKTSDVKMNKLINISNKVKIKYVNTQSTLDYLYEKYHVDDSKELKRQWGEYVKIKDEEERFKKNSDLLEYCCNDLITNFKIAGVKFPEVWVYQPEALLDNREMVEVRHRLNTRRQRLREQMDAAGSRIENCHTEIAGIRKRYPEYDSAIEDILVKRGIVRQRG